MDLTGWIVSAAVPFVIAALAGALAIGLGVRRSADDSLSTSTALRDFLATLVLSLGWAAAVTAGLVGYRIARGETALDWWPEDFWQRGYWAISAAAILLGATARAPWRDRPVRWVAAGLLAVATAALALPSGEGWEDMLPMHQGWLALLTCSCLLGLWSLDRLSGAAADRWFPLVVLATLAGPMLVAAATYMGLVQWTIAAVAATIPIVVFALLGWVDSRTAVGIAYPAAAFATTMMSAGRFSSYEDHPWWSYLGMLSVPVAIALVDYPLRRTHGGIRAIFAALVALLAIGISAWLQYRPEDPGAGDW